VQNPGSYRCCWHGPQLEHTANDFLFADEASNERAGRDGQKDSR